MFDFFKKKSGVKDFSFLKVDMHSHLIPGIDDGAQNMEESMNLIGQLKKLGYKKLITTPHIMQDYYPNSPKTIQSGLEAVKKTLVNRDIDIALEVAAEYYVDDYFMTQIENKQELLTFSNGHILFEFSMLLESHLSFEVIFQLNALGYKPILAHPERYLYYTKSFNKFEKMKSFGCLFQVNLLSLAGYYGPDQKKLGLKLLDAGMVDLFGTDLHNERQIIYLEEIVRNRKLFRKLESIEANCTSAYLHISPSPS